MPWSIFKDGRQYCVHKLQTDGSKGERVACHPTRARAEAQLRALYANEPQGESMRHLDMETKAKDEGVFTAVVAAYTQDRQGEMIMPGAFASSLVRWQASGKRIPVIWNHGAHDPEMVVGWIDPANAKETEDGLEVTGQVDLSTAAGKRTFELMKQGSMSYSFGYVVPPDGERKRSDGVVELTEVDLMEVTVTPVPANADTHTLTVKAGQAVYVDPNTGAATVVGVKAEPVETTNVADLFAPEELEGCRTGFLKWAWTRDYVDDLSDASFLYVAPGGTKDAVSRTIPRHLRRFPYRDADGEVNMPRLRSFLAGLAKSDLPPADQMRIGARVRTLIAAREADLPSETKNELVERAEKALEQAVTDRPRGPGSPDPGGHDPETAEWDNTLLEARST